MIETLRLRIRRWKERDRAPFAAMNADPEVMLDLGGPISREASDVKYDRIASAQRGLSRWLVERHDGLFLGYTGVFHRDGHQALGAHYDVGWRLVRNAWGHGYATEATSAALEDAFMRVKVPEALAYTAPDNVRSRAVMARLNLKRDRSRDFTVNPPGRGAWNGLVWVARPANHASIGRTD